MTFEEVICLLTTSHCYWYLAHSHDFLNRLLWEILTSLSAIFNSGDVTWPSLFFEFYLYEVMQQKISQYSSVENNSLWWFSSWWWILSLMVIHEKRKMPVQSNPIQQIQSGFCWGLANLLFLQQQPVAGILFCFIEGDSVNNWVFLTAILYKVTLCFYCLILQ